MLRAAGFDEDEAPGAVAIARALLGPDCIVRGSRASMVSLHGQQRIRLPRRRSPAEMNFLVGHELAEWWLKREGYVSEWIEDVANALAASLVAPRRAFLRAYREHGHDYTTLASLFCSSESLVVLRIGEVTGEPVLLVAPHRARARGEAFGWPSQLRGASRFPGLAKCRLSDDDRRLVVRRSGSEE